MTFYWMVCPMIVAGAGSCHSGMSYLGLIVDWITCIAFALMAAGLSMHIARKDFVKRTRFWITTTIVFGLAFLLVSLGTLVHSASHHGHAIEIGFPVVYLYEYAGDSFNALNFVTDLMVCFVAALLCVASFFKGDHDQTLQRASSKKSQ